MNKVLQTLTKFGLYAALIAGTSFCGYGQKLSNVQEGSVLAPANVKIDAKTTEWNDAFKAYNKTTLINYTLANDDKNLYLVVKSADQGNNRKIVAGGITLTINTADKKKEKDAFAITFPLVSRDNIRSQFRSRGFGGGLAPTLDSTDIANMRKQILATAKEIKLSGFKSITDSVIAIYNEYGIKTAISYDDMGSLIYELAVPLNLFSISTDNPKEFAYNIKLNGLQFSSRDRDGSSRDREGGSSREGGESSGGGSSRSSGSSRGSYSGGGGRSGRSSGSSGGGSSSYESGRNDMQSLISPTDFWGKYTLIKK